MVTVHAERYKVMLQTFLRIEIHPRQKDLLWFQQDGAASHTAKFPCKSTGQCFSVGDITLPARLLGHAAPDYFLWGYGKKKKTSFFQYC